MFTGQSSYVVIATFMCSRHSGVNCSHVINHIFVYFNSKVSRDTLYEAVREVQSGSRRKRRK